MQNETKMAAIAWNESGGGCTEPVLVTLDRKQVAALARAVAVAVTEWLAATQTAGRSSFTIAEVAQRAGFSEGYVRDAMRLGLLRVVRPGGRDLARVLPEDEALWLSGRIKEDESPAVGLSDKIAARNRIRAIVAHVMRAGVGEKGQ